MRVQEYDAFVRQTDLFATRQAQDRERVAILGLAGEIGSLVSAAKKQLLEELRFEQPTAEIREELGDIIWYCFSLAQAHNAKPINIFTRDIANLKKYMSGGDEASRKIQAALTRSKVTEFLEAADRFPRTETMEFADYQKLAFLTARTEGLMLMGVCLAVLGQLAAEVLRQLLPASELDLNRTLPDRDVNDILGEVAWHVAAMASLMGLSLDDLAEDNRRKVDFRSNRSIRTPWHDLECGEDQRLPTRFDIVFVTVAPGRSRMYWNGRQLGDELTDNAHDADGYRFHDVMHLALAAKLGWSPVLRKLMKRKRKDFPMIDEVEDGARAQIVEELVVKAIHAEGERVARANQPGAEDVDLRLFQKRADITYRFLGDLHRYVDGLEAAANRFWEWEEAILLGSSMYRDLRTHGQGTVSIDREAGTMSYREEIDLDLQLTGMLVGSAQTLLPPGASDAQKRTALEGAARVVVGLRPDEGRVDVELSATGRIGPRLRPFGLAAEALWRKGGIVFRAETVESEVGWSAVVMAIGDRPIA